MELLHLDIGVNGCLVDAQRGRHQPTWSGDAAGNEDLCSEFVDGESEWIAVDRTGDAIDDSASRVKKSDVAARKWDEIRQIDGARSVVMMDVLVIDAETNLCKSHAGRATGGWITVSNGAESTCCRVNCVGNEGALVVMVAQDFQFIWIVPLVGEARSPLSSGSPCICLQIAPRSIKVDNLLGGHHSILSCRLVAHKGIEALCRGGIRINLLICHDGFAINLDRYKFLGDEHRIICLS